MAIVTRETVGRKIVAQKKQLHAEDGLPFRELLSVERVLAVVQELKFEYRERIFPPMVTLWAFLSQVIGGKESSCSDAVSRVLVDRVLNGQEPCSAETTSYCEARRRLPEEAFSELTRQVGQELYQQARPEWLFKGRRVVIVDGSTVTMADTAENQREYPQSSTQKPGLGFPILRFVVLFSLATGALLNCAIGACRGKKTGEQSLFRAIMDALGVGDILIGDCLYDCYHDIAALKQRGVDCVLGKKQSRHIDFRKGRRIGRDDHVVVWTRPKYDPSRFESRQQWDALPEEIEMREIRIRVCRPGYRARTVVIVTTLIDAGQYTAKELTDLFLERWNCELDLRSIKQSLGMEHLQCKSPAMVRKELWTYLLAYNLIRVRMAQAADLAGVLPRQLSFASAQKYLNSFAPHLSTTRGTAHRRLELEMLKAIAQCKIKTRKPGRKEPRKIKKRQQKYSFLTTPREQARKGLKA